jgi:hypothetical protein
MNAPADDALAHFVAKWLQREPEMRFAEPFLPPLQRARAQAWGALLHELREAAFELSDPGVARAKTAWWAEELLRTAAGEARHPLTARLDAGAPWAAFSRELLRLTETDGRSASTTEALDALLPAAQAAAAVEARLFDAHADADVARSLGVHWLLSRLPQGLADEDQARLPMHLLARHGLTAAELPSERSRPLLRDWGAELLAIAPERLAPGAALFRRARHRLDRPRLRALAGEGLPRPPSPPAALWQAWRAARGA